MPERSEHAEIEQNREQHLARLFSESFDVAVIGGGINGAAIGRDAAMRGLRVALIDKGDFAGATSSRSSKLIHGGLRYLPQGQLRLVYRALQERERLRRLTAPHLVHPIRFLFPFYRGQRPGRIAVSIGLLLYDSFARTVAAERHRRISRNLTIAAEPALKSENLSGAAVYYDAWGDDARITLENVLDAAHHGAAVANYLALEGFSRSRGAIAAAVVRDVAGGQTFEIRAARFVNAAGPWIDDIRRMDDAGCGPSVRLTKGAHLVIEASRLPVRNSLVLADNGRIIFVMRHGNYVLVGTTDTDVDTPGVAVAADPSDVAYLLNVICDALPAVRLCDHDVAYSFAGLRALVVSGEGRRPSMVPREEVMLESKAGLLTVAGGKLTTHREIAQRVTARLLKALQRPVGECPTLRTPLLGARAVEGLDADLVEVPTEIRETLRLRYGSRARLIGRMIAERPELAQRLSPDAPAIAAEVIHAVRHEFARSVDDFLVRRTSMVWRAPHAAWCSAPAVARLMAAELAWDHAREQAELDAFFRRNPPRLPGQILRNAGTTVDD